MRQIIYIALFFLSLSCKNKEHPNDGKPTGLTADSIVNASITQAGLDKIANTKLSFQFRDQQYLANRNNGRFVLARLSVNDNEDSIFDVLSNEGFERFVNNEQIQLPDSLIARYEPSVNSVHYFSVLPYGLNDKAVKKELLGEEIIKGDTYHKIKVTFSEDGGGEDFEDVFIYWMNTSNFNMDYLAYSYAENSSQGLRFREAYNLRRINGVQFADYNNYKPKESNTSLDSLGVLFENNNLDLVSKVELENIQIDLIDNL